MDQQSKNNSNQLNNILELSGPNSESSDGRFMFDGSPRRCATRSKCLFYLPFTGIGCGSLNGTAFNCYSDKKTNDADVVKRGLGPVYINDKPKRSVTFSKRKKGIIKKAREIGVMTGSEVMVLIKNENNRSYFYGTPRMIQYIRRERDSIMEFIGSSQLIYESLEDIELYQYTKSSFENDNGMFTRNNNIN